MNHPLIEPLEARIAPATLSISSSVSFQEGDSGTQDFDFVVTLMGAITSDVTVHYASANGAATTADGDYTAVSGTLTFSPGDTTRVIHVPVFGDEKFEGEENFTVTLDTPTGEGELSPGGSVGIGRIANDDGMPTVSVGDVSAPEGGVLAFPVQLSNPTEQTVTVFFSTGDVTATVADGDYTGQSNVVVTFAPGETLKTVNVVVAQDGKFELDETVRAVLSDVNGSATLDDDEALGTIVNDDARPTVSVGSLTIVEGESGTKNLVFSVVLSSSSPETVTVMAGTADGTALAGSDYTAVAPMLLTFAPGATSQQFTVPIRGDVLDEVEETFAVELSSATNATLGSNGTGTILNDEIRVRIEDASVTETEGDVTISFPVRLSTASSHAVTVNYRTGEGSANSLTGDFVAVPLGGGSVTFLAGETLKMVNVTVRGDAVGELEESFFLNLDGAVNASVFDNQAVGTIRDNDAALSISDVRVVEGGTGGTTLAVFTVRLDRGPVGTTLLVDVATGDGTATDGVVADGDPTEDADYTKMMATLTFAPGETVKTFSVPVLGDVLFEGNQDFLVNLSNARTSTGDAVMGILARDSATGTILNDDGAVFSINDVTITEGDSGSANAIFLVTLLNAPGQSVRVNVATEDGTASSVGDNRDFTAVTQTLTFSGTQTQQVVSVPIRGDLTRESAETFSVFLSAATGNSVMSTIMDDMGVGTILDNNDSGPVVSIGTGTLVEGNAGTSTMFFTATLSKAASELVTVHFKTNDGTATTANQDYTGILDNVVTFEPGQTTATIPVVVRGDLVDEVDENFGVALFSPVGAVLGTSAALGTIRNDDVTISVEVLPADLPSVIEGNNGTKTITFQVKLNQAPVGHDVTVNFATEDGTAISTGGNADYAGKTGSLTFTPANGGVAQEVRVTINGDARVELDEQFFLKLISSVNGTIDPMKTMAAGTIGNDDGAPVVSIGDAQLTEGDSGTKTMTFTVTLDKPTDAAVTVKATTANGTATTADPDYTSIAGQLITFAAGETSKTFTVPITGDADDEQTETFTVMLTDATNSTLGDATGTGTILDNDARTISINDVGTVEGNAGTSTITFTVSLSSAATQQIMVDVATADGSAVSTGAAPDFVSKIETLTFAPGVTSRTFSVTVNGDAVAEGNERLFANLSNAINGLLTADTQGSGLLLDDETTVKLELPVGGSATVSEEIGTNRDQSIVVFRVVREGDLSNAVSVQYTTVDGAATGAGTRPDFVPQSGTITFAAGSSVASARIEVPVVKDFNYENSESFQVRLFNPINAAVLSGSVAAIQGSEMVTITDNDVAPTLSIADARLVEGDTSAPGTMTFAVTLSAANERESVTVDYKFTDGTGVTGAHKAVQGLLLQDYTGTDGVLAFTGGATVQTISVSILGDARDEADEETFLVDLSNMRNGAVGTPDGITDVQATGTIVDNDAAPTLRFFGTAGGDIPLTEGNAGTKQATFTLELSQISERAVAVNVTTKDGTALSVGTMPDFAALTNFTASYTPGTADRLFTFSVPVNGDVLDEANETFKVTLSDAQFARITDNGATATITDDDAAPTIAINEVSVLEGNSGTTDLIFTVSLSAPSGQEVGAVFQTIDGTAVSTGPLADYIEKVGTVFFEPGELTKEVRIKINGDTFVETDEQFTVALSGAVNGTLATGASTGIGRILQDGDTAAGIVIGNGFISEGDSGAKTMTFKVELTGPQGSATTFKVKSQNGTAVVGSDFNSPTTQTITIGAGSTSANVTVSVNGDGNFEPTESFFIDLRNVSSGVQVIDGTGRGTIYNDDLNRVNDQTLQYIDVDGDLVTVRVSKGVLETTDLFFTAVNNIGGRQLAVIDFTDDGDEFQDTDLFVTAKEQTGFRGNPKGRQSDGFVNVGFVQAAIPQNDVLQFVNAHDLGTVKIDGDLGKITAGDTFADTAIGSLQVRSMGIFGTKTQGSATDTSLNTVSQVLGPIESINVKGTFSGSLQLIGAQFGKIRNLFIGELRGTDADGSGQLFFTGKLKNGFIGQIVGGAGTNSGLVSGSFASNASIENLTLGGGLIGGAGAGSGRILAPQIESLTLSTLIGGAGDVSGVIGVSEITNLLVKGDVVGAGGANSGEISVSGDAGTIKVKGALFGGAKRDAGSIVVTGNVDFVQVSDGLLGGRGRSSASIQIGGAAGEIETGGIVGFTGEKSGTIVTGGQVTLLRVQGDLEGGAGNGSGGIVVGGKLVNGAVGGDIIGGDSLAATSAMAATSLVKSGYVIAKKIENFRLNGDLVAGHNDGAGLALSGTIRSRTAIESITIHGSLVGNESAAAIIAAVGTQGQPRAIVDLKIDGNATFAEILAGYNASATTTDVRGEAVNADARLGTVRITGNVRDTSIVAGVSAGDDGLFGGADDVLIGGEGTTDRGGSLAKIAQIIIGGAVQTGTRSSAIVTQFIEAVNLGGVNIGLSAGAGSDLDRTRELVSGSNLRIFEVPVSS